MQSQAGPGAGCRPCALLVPRATSRQRVWGFWARLRYRLFG
jgi:hypothetical protein